MKKFIILLLLFISFSLPFNDIKNVNANINSGYLRVITEDTPFYSDEGLNNFLFYLPYTYYVKVLSDYGNVVHIECYGNGTPAIDGYVLKELLFSDGLAVNNPYAKITLSTIDNTAFFSSKSCNKVLQYIFPERNLSYYGHAFTESGEILYYVGYNGKLGYVKEESVLPFTLPNHPNELTFIKPEEPEEPEQSPDDNLPSTSNGNETYILRVAVILAIIFAGFVAIFAVKNPKKSKSTSYYDENDYT